MSYISKLLRVCYRLKSLFGRGPRSSRMPQARSRPPSLGGVKFVPAPAIDPLTGLASRLVLEAQITKAIVRSTRFGTGLVVLWVELHDLERAVKLLGRDVADAALIVLARRLRALLKMESALARVRFRAFAAMHEGVVDDDELVQTVAALHDALACPFDVCEGMIHIASGVGFASYPDDGTDASTLLAAAAMRAVMPRNRHPSPLRSLASAQVEAGAAEVDAA
ncbi:MAG: hypothetical protein CVU25_07390 [Betaproteobacteria bacterium HGW-Betaproteobacteria-19]|nr:MAG: hypothetical protein CVU25_07390 [Betaproteobacteria bacterium HGW-Betaproteobacteria-19]